MLWRFWKFLKVVAVLSVVTISLLFLIFGVTAVMIIPRINLNERMREVNALIPRAEAGDADSQLKLARHYEIGYHLPGSSAFDKSPEKAAYWHRRYQETIKRKDPYPQSGLAP